MDISTDTADHLALYEYTMSSPDVHASGFVLAPSDAAAEALAARWPTANGWPLGTEWTVARVCTLLTVDDRGDTTEGTHIATFAEGVTR